MRLLFPVALALVVLTSDGLAAPAPTGRYSNFAPAQDCRNATMQLTRKGGIWQFDRLKPKKLTELPPADSYAAVYRRDERGCIVPVEYRDVRR